MSPPALLIHGGESRHGVAHHAARVAEAVARLDPRVRLVGAAPDVGDGPLHVHFTDRLWGRDPASAADRLVALADRRRLTVTLHDVPQASDGPASLRRRRAAYRAVAAASDGIVVSSDHERALLSEEGTLDAASAAAVTVIPLPVEPVLGRPSGGIGDDDVVALLGFFYPGKGHAEAVDAVAGLPAPRPAVRALGASAPGHESELAALTAAARDRAVDFAATGWLSDDALAAHARRVQVPLAAHGHVSASGSINSWVGFGRIPLVVDSRYAREVERLRPGTIRRCAPADLGAEIARVRRAPHLGWARPGLDTRPHLADVAAAYLRFWAER